MASVGDERDVEYDPKAVSIIRQNWIDKQLKQREREFTNYVTSSIFCGTYNVNAKVIADEDVGNLNEWLFGKEEPMADIYAIGFQEIVDLNAVNVAMDGKSAQRATAWTDKLQYVLNAKGGERYTMVLEKHLVGILLVVFLKDKHRAYTSDVYGATVGVGILGMAGNKGGASIRFKFYDSHICFVCAHLAAHRENVEGRNGDFAKIIQQTLFLEKGAGDVSSGVDTTDAIRKYFSEALEVEPSLANGMGIMDHDHVFWMGDLNYRLDESVTIEECFAKIEQRDFEYLRKYDQLNMERLRGKVFPGWMESVLTFAPTYKYEPKTNLYEKRPEKKLRCPAWCDRVLWKSKDMAQVRLLTYRRAELLLSDHKPVAALLQAKVRTVIKEEKVKVANEIQRMLDRVENDSHPKVALEVPGGRAPNLLDFGNVHYGVDAHVTLKVTNVAQVPAHFHFVPKLEEENVCKPWLTMRPRFGMLLPGDVADITFTINVDTKTAQDLSSAQDVLDDILILRLENGQDFFLSVKGSYARSCFGMPLDELINCYDPVRSLPLPSADWNPPAPLSRRPSNVAGLSVPKELWRLVDAIYRTGLREKDLFIVPGTPSEVIAVREALDTGTDFPPCSVHSLAETLTGLLTSLPQPVIGQKLLPTMELDAQNLRPWTRRFLEQLAPLNYNVFVYLISFFREVLKHHECNRLNSERVAVICCNVLLPGGGSGGAMLAPEEGGKKREEDDQRSSSMQAIFTHFLTTQII